jgi:hypothetical protein
MKTHCFKQKTQKSIIMAWFSKKKEVESESNKAPELPKLPELPPLNAPVYALPQKQITKSERLPTLPSMPKGSIGEKMTQNMIKEAVGTPARTKIMKMQEYPDQDIEEMQEEDGEYVQEYEAPPEEFHEAARIIRKKEPIFIRLDKFEDSLRSFEEIKDKVSEIKDLLNEIKEIKDHEESELQQWEEELQEMKSQIEKIDSNLFSRIQ